MQANSIKKKLMKFLTQILGFFAISFFKFISREKLLTIFI